MLQLSVESMPGAWTESTSLDVCGTYVRTVEKAGQKATLVVRTRSITNVQMQVMTSTHSIMMTFDPHSGLRPHR